MLMPAYFTLPVDAGAEVEDVLVDDLDVVVGGGVVLGFEDVVVDLDVVVLAFEDVVEPAPGRHWE